MTTLPMNTPDYWTPATDTDKRRVIALIAAMWKRQSGDNKVHEELFMMALKGVTKWGLKTGFEKIVQGVLGHAFPPNQMELRQQIDKVMQPHVEMRDRIAERERRLQWDEDKIAPPSAEERKRVGERMAAFRASLPLTRRELKGQQMAAERAALRLRYGMTPERVAALPGAPGIVGPLLLIPPPTDPGEAIVPPPLPPPDEALRAQAERDWSRPSPSEETFRRLNARREQQGLEPVQPAMPARRKRNGAGRPRQGRKRA